MRCAAVRSALFRRRRCPAFSLKYQHGFLHHSGSKPSSFNELMDRVSLDGEFLQESLFRTKQVDDFTRRLLEIHEKMMAINEKEGIRLGLHRSDYMLDSETNSLLQIELNTISTSFPGLSSLVSELHRLPAYLQNVLPMFLNQAPILTVQPIYVNFREVLCLVREEEVKDFI